MVAQLRRAIGGAKNVKLQCDECGAVFASKYSLRDHLMSRHSGEQRPFGCDWCSRRFALVVDVSRHVRRVHASRLRQLQQQ